MAGLLPEGPMTPVVNRSIHPETQDLIGNVLAVAAVLQLIAIALPGIAETQHGTGTCAAVFDGGLAYGFYKGQEWAAILTRIRCVLGCLLLPIVGIFSQSAFPFLLVGLYFVPLYLLAGPRSVSLRRTLLPMIIAAGVLTVLRFAAILLGVRVPLFT